MSGRTTSIAEENDMAKSRHLPKPFWGSFGVFAADIKLAHSIFALPFAASTFLLSSIAFPGPRDVLLLLVCMVTARSFAMGMNRYLDRVVDAENPRTQQRKIPGGELSSKHALSWSLLAALLFIAAAFGLNDLAGYCSVPLLLILMGYSFQKRVSWLTHWYLGACLGLAPIAVAIALSDSLPPTILLLGLAVTMWTAGFDILYSLQDLDYDRGRGLHSVPARFGPNGALWLSRLSFFVMVCLLVVVGLLANRGGTYYVGVLVVSGILTFEHVLVRDARTDGKSTRINAAFFNANAYVSVVFFAFALADRLFIV